MIWCDAEERDGAIREAMAFWDCAVSALRMDVYPNGRARIRYIQPGERWLDWISDNHGWGARTGQ